MQRSTHRDERGYYLMGDGIYSDWGAPEKFRGDDVDRLAAYEDTGLEPEVIKAIANALSGKTSAKGKIWCNECGDALVLDIADGELTIGCFGCGKYIPVTKLMKVYTELDKHEIDFARLRELAQADKEGRIRILSAGKGKTCGTCANFQPVPGHKCGDCKARKYFRASQSRKACSMYIGKDGSYAD